MNIGIFSDCYLPTPNGVSRSVHHLKEGLEARGHRVVLVTPAGFQGARLGERGEQRGGPRGDRFPQSDRLDGSRQNPGRTEETRAYSVPSFPFNRSLSLNVGLATAAAMRRIVHEEGLEIIHTHTEFSIGRAARRAGLELGIPIVHTFHTMYEDYRHYLPLDILFPAAAVRRWIGGFLQPYRAVVCPSAKSRFYLRGILPRDTTVRIPNGIELPMTPQESAVSADPARRALSVVTPGGSITIRRSPSDKVLLYAGRLSPEKRSTQLLAALVPLLEHRHDTVLILAGGGSSRKQLEGAVRRHGLQDRILFTGILPHQQLQALYAAADIFVTAALSENHPLTLLEAAAAGLPLVVREDPGCLEVVRKDYNGLRLQADHDIGPAVSRLLDDSERMKHFGEKSLSAARSYDRDLQAARVEALYLGCLSSDGTSRHSA